MGSDCLTLWLRKFLWGRVVQVTVPLWLLIIVGLIVLTGLVATIHQAYQLMQRSRSAMELRKLGKKYSEWDDSIVGFLDWLDKRRPEFSNETAFDILVNFGPKMVHEVLEEDIRSSR